MGRMSAVVPGALIVLSLCSLPAWGASIYKCGMRDGRIVYQGTACAAGSRRLAQWTADPDPVLALTDTKTAEPSRRSAGASRSRRSATTRMPRAENDACAAAKARREEVERRVGLARTYELLATLSRDVFDACK